MDTWGLMPKSQEDNETIEEAIARLIDVHEADSESHLGAGESLETHRAQDVIDHPAESIVPDKFEKNFYDKAIYSGFWQTLDCFNVSGANVQVVIGQIAVIAGPTLNDIAYAYAKTGGAYNIDFNIDFVYEFTTFCLSGSHGLCYGGAGTPVSGSGNGFVGIKQLDNKLYACVGDASFANVTNTELSGIVPNGLRRMRIEFEAGVEVRFYVDGVLKATITTNMPTTANATFLHIWAQCNSAGSPVGMYSGPVQYQPNV